METTSLAGRLLVATPSLVDPNFDRTVVFLLQHTPDEGAMGLVLNRPSGLPVSEHVEGWGELAAPPDEVFLGGPVQPEIAFALAWTDPGQPLPEGVEPVTDRCGVVDLRRDPGEFAGVLLGLRIFSGYAGWAPGQLEMELLTGSWFTLDAEPSDTATPDPDNLWRQVFRRQRARDLRLMSTYPEDPTLN